MTTDGSTPTLPASEVVLRDGRRVRFRPIRPDDRDRWIEFFSGLSPRTRYLRFQYAKKTATEEEIANFIHVVPPERVAYIATTGRGDSERIIAIGRWDATNQLSAEIAFAVADDAQGRGVGTALLEHLADAAVRFGFETFEAQVLAENKGMINVFESSGLETESYEEGGLVYLTMDLLRSDEFRERRAEREHRARVASMRRLLNPARVAVIGASRDLHSVGNAILRNIISCGFQGAAFPVNRAATSVNGMLAYPSLLDVPGEVDLAIVCVPAAGVPEVAEECARKGTAGIVVISAGFRETGGGGADLEATVRDTVLGYGGRMIGPNCLGVINNNASVALNASFAAERVVPGNVSMASQSGALGLALLDYAASINMGVAQFISIGNRADVSSNDLLEYWEDDPETGVILLYLESFGNPERFSRIARRVSGKKPIVALKGGRSQAGARAAASHTASLAGSDSASEALFAQSGIIHAHSMEEMFGVARVLAYQPVPAGNRVAIVTNAGGPGILAADVSTANGLDVPELPTETQEELRSFLPASAAVGNPVDMIASATPEQFQKTVSTLLQSESADLVLVIYVPPVVTTPEEVAAALKDVSAKASGKTVAACFMMYGKGPADIVTTDGARIPVFNFPEDAAQALGHTVRYGTFRSHRAVDPPKLPHTDRRSAIHLISSAGRRWLYPEEALELFALYGIGVAKTEVAMSAAEAVRVARQTGMPVAMKLRSTKLVHKTEVGGIHLGLDSAAAVERAYASIRRAVDDDAMEGVIIQPMVTGGREMIIGMARDPVFGPVIMTGLGGVEVEAFRDVAFSLVPMSGEDPDRMLQSLRTFPLLTGWRGTAPPDVEALKDALFRFAKLCHDLPEVETLEINPLMALEAGAGCVAVDARVFVDPARRWKLDATA